MAASDKMTDALAGILIPKDRQRALQDLCELGLISEASRDMIAGGLDHPKYNQRGMARLIVPIKKRIDSFVYGSRFCVLSPTKTLNQIPKQLRLINDLTNQYENIGEWLKGRNVLDFGAGRYNLFNNAILSYVNGANAVYMLEPAEVDWKYSLASARELVSDIFFEPSKYNLGALSSSEMKTRLSDIDWADIPESEIEMAEFGPISFMRSIHLIPDDTIDLTFSSSVLEHVTNITEEVESLNRVSRAFALGVHTVDYTAHQKTTKNYDPFSLYYGEKRGLNGLRPCDLRDIFEAAGYSVRECGQRNGQESQIDYSKIHPEYHKY